MTYITGIVSGVCQDITGFVCEVRVGTSRSSYLALIGRFCFRGR